MSCRRRATSYPLSYTTFRVVGPFGPPVVVVSTIMLLPPLSSRRLATIVTGVPPMSCAVSITSVEPSNFAVNRSAERNRVAEEDRGRCDKFMEGGPPQDPRYA